MKRILLFVLAAVLAAAVLAGCSLTESLNPPAEESEASGAADTAPADLTGFWASEDQCYTAEVTEDEIIVMLAAGGEEELYWRGTYDPPKEGGSPYIWLSVNNAINIHNDVICRDSVKMFMAQEGKIEMSTDGGTVILTRQEK